MLNFKEYSAWLDWSSVSLGGGFLVVSKKEASSKEDLVGKSNLCRRPFCPSLWLCGRGSAVEIALQSVTTLSNHQCIHNEGFHLKLCEPHFIQNGGGKKVVPLSFCPSYFHCRVVCENHSAGIISAFSVGHFSSAFYFSALCQEWMKNMITRGASRKHFLL